MLSSNPWPEPVTLRTLGSMDLHAITVGGYQDQKMPGSQAILLHEPIYMTHRGRMALAGNEKGLPLQKETDDAEKLEAKYHKIAEV